jgi:hypothetical protein
MFQMLTWLPAIVFCSMSLSSFNLLVFVPGVLLLMFLISIAHRLIFESETAKGLSKYLVFFAIWLMQCVIIMFILSIMN